MEEYKQIYKEIASLVPNYKKLSTNEVANLYVASENKFERDSYLSVLMLRYWNKIATYKFRAESLRVDETEIMNWLVNSIMYALDHHVWLDPENKLYGDKHAFDKVVNRCLESNRCTAYQAANRHKRKDAHDNVSLDKLIAEYNDSTYNTFDNYVQDEKTKEDFNEIEVFQMVVELFDAKDYFKAFLVDAICHYDVFNNGSFSPKKAKYHMMRLGSIAHNFANMYNIPVADVETAVSYIDRLGYGKINYKFTYHMNELRRMIA